MPPCTFFKPDILTGLAERVELLVEALSAAKGGIGRVKLVLIGRGVALTSSPSLERRAVLSPSSHESSAIRSRPNPTRRLGVASGAAAAERPRLSWFDIFGEDVIGWRLVEWISARGLRTLFALFAARAGLESAEVSFRFVATDAGGDGRSSSQPHMGDASGDRDKDGDDIVMDSEGATQMGE